MIALTCSLVALIKLLAWEKSTHRVEYVTKDQKEALKEELDLPENPLELGLALGDGMKVPEGLQKTINRMFDNLGDYQS